MMTMIAPNKAAKAAANAVRLDAQWHGQTAQALIYWQSLVPKNAAKRMAWGGSLEKNNALILADEQRQPAGKVIGSGRLEKQHEVLVAQRQKRKGRSWSKPGWLSLTFVTAHLLSLADARLAYLL